MRMTRAVLSSFLARSHGIAERRSGERFRESSIQRIFGIPLLCNNVRIREQARILASSMFTGLHHINSRFRGFDIQKADAKKR